MYRRTAGGLRALLTEHLKHAFDNSKFDDRVWGTAAAVSCFIAGTFSVILCFVSSFEDSKGSSDSLEGGGSLSVSQSTRVSRDVIVLSVLEGDPRATSTVILRRQGSRWLPVDLDGHS